MSDEKRGGKFWAGWVLTALPALGLILSGAMKVSHAPQFLVNWAKFGYPVGLLNPIGITEIICAVLLLIPRTAVLGAILVTGYLGGAVATHVRVMDPAFITPLILGMVAWLGLFLRDARLRALLPFVK